MVSTHRVHQHERDDLCSRTELSTESIEKHGSQASTLEEQYKFFQEMRGYVRDLVECLNEKVSVENSLVS
jgi:GC-rich sequence DNA-binding factor